MRLEGDSMEVHCSSCGEPWDTYHLRHNAIFEINLDSAEAEVWRSLPTQDRLNPRYREKFKEAGWQFGQSMMNVIHCPSCRVDVKPDPERIQTKRALEQLFGDDKMGWLRPLRITAYDHKSALFGQVQTWPHCCHA
jgi:hypothetical protein